MWHGACDRRVMAPRTQQRAVPCPARHPPPPAPPRFDPAKLGCLAGCCCCCCCFRNACCTTDTVRGSLETPATATLTPTLRESNAPYPG